MATVSVKFTDYGVQVRGGVLVNEADKTVVALEGGFAKIGEGELGNYGVYVELGGDHVVVPLEKFLPGGSFVVEQGGTVRSGTVEGLTLNVLARAFAASFIVLAAIFGVLATAGKRD